MTLSIAAPVKMTALMFRPVHFAPSAIAITFESFTAELILTGRTGEQETAMSKNSGLGFLRRAVEQNRHIDSADLRLILRDFEASEADNAALREKYMNAVKDNAEVARINADYLVELVDLRKRVDVALSYATHDEACAIEGKGTDEIDAEFCTCGFIKALVLEEA